MSPKKSPYRHQGHKLRTRRDFLAQGYLGTCGLVIAPSLLALLESRVAYAADCATGAETAGLRAGFLCFDLAGGANIAGSNVVVGRGGGQEDYLTTYETLGLPANMHPSKPGQTDAEMGLVFHADSAILRGIKARTTAEIRARCEGAVFCTSSADDTSNNPHNPSYWIHKGGATGRLAALCGTQNNDSGGNSQAPALSIEPTARPVTIRKPDDALGLVDVGRLAEMLSLEKAEKIMKAIGDLSGTQLAAFSRKDLPAQVAEVVRCGYLSSRSLISEFSPQALDPRQDQMVTEIFGDLAGDQGKVGTIAKLVCDGFVGVGTIEAGGYDYHNNTRATGEAKDFEAGEHIGQALSLAAAKNRDLVIYVFSDGGIVAAPTIDGSTGGRGKFVWRGDSSQRSAAFMIVYKADGKPALRGERQLGAFKDNGAVDNEASRVSNNVESLAKCVTANYLALHGDEGQLARVIGDDPFGADLDDYLIFDKLRG